VLDLDEFKQINDSLGHAAGDRALKCFAGYLKDSLRESDHLIRWGGDEFVVVLPHTEPGDAALVIERIRHGLLLATAKTPPCLRFSAGVAGLPEHAVSNPQALFDLADAALRDAKLVGKSTVSLPIGELGRVEPTILAGPQRPRALVMALAPGVRDEASRALRAAGYEADAIAPGPIDRLRNLPPIDVLVVASSSLTQEAQQSARRVRNDRGEPAELVVFSEHGGRREAIAAIAERRLRHVVGSDEALFSTLVKLALVDPSGLARHLAPGARTLSVTVRQAEEKRLALEALHAAALHVACPERLADKLVAAVDEMILHAVGGKSLAGAPGRAIVQWGSDARRFAVSVADPFGSLGEHELFEQLRVAVALGSDSGPNASQHTLLGFRTMLHHLSRLYVNLSPGQLTEVIGVVDLTLPVREQQARVPDFGVFSRRP
jgi:diguanylate cyclase (GGDEF)-like protein